MSWEILIEMRSRPEAMRLLRRFCPSFLQPIVLSAVPRHSLAPLLHPWTSIRAQRTLTIISVTKIICTDITCTRGTCGRRQLRELQSQGLAILAMGIVKYLLWVKPTFSAPAWSMKFDWERIASI